MGAVQIFFCAYETSLELQNSSQKNCHFIISSFRPQIKGRVHQFWHFLYSPRWYSNILTVLRIWSTLTAAFVILPLLLQEGILQKKNHWKLSKSDILHLESYKALELMYVSTGRYTFARQKSLNCFDFISKVGIRRIYLSLALGTAKFNLD